MSHRIVATTVLLLLTTVSLHSAANPLAGQIIVDPNNPSWLIHAGGGPAVITAPGDPEDFLYRGSRNSDGTRDGDQEQLINKLIGTGANAIYLMAVRSHGGDGGADQNPFIDGDPSKGLDTEMLDQWEAWFDLMDRNGIVIFFIFYDDSARVWSTGDTIGVQETSFIQNLVNRFEHHRNLIWVVAEEYQERFSPAAVSDFARIVRQADDHDHVIAVHKLAGLDFEEFADDPNIDQFAIQYRPSSATPKGYHRAMVEAWNRAAGRYNLNLAEPVRGTFVEDRRQKAWAVVMAGAHVMPIEMDIASNSSAQLEELGRIRLFMESTNVNSMAPHDELALADTNYVLASDAHSYILYGRNVQSELGVQGIAPGQYTLHWFDTLTGESVEEIVDTDGGNASFTKPPGFSTEIALHLALQELRGDAPAPPRNAQVE